MSISFSVAKSITGSISIFVRFAFWDSSIFKRRVSEISMLPYLDRHLKNIVSLIPCSRQSSFAPSPAFYSFNIRIIFSLLTRFLFISCHLIWRTSNNKNLGFLGAQVNGSGGNRLIITCTHSLKAKKLNLNWSKNQRVAT